MNQQIASTYDASARLFALPSTRISGAENLEALATFGILAHEGPDSITGFRRCTMPAGWTPVPAAESTMQLRWHDEQDRLRLKVFYKPGSQGGRGSMQLTPRFTVVLQTTDTLQWAEVYDGNELIHSTASSARKVDDHGYGAYRQPEYAEAEAWLSAIRPDHADPLAYWN